MTGVKKLSRNGTMRKGKKKDEPWDEEGSAGVGEEEMEVSFKGESTWEMGEDRTPGEWKSEEKETTRSGPAIGDD